VGPLDVHITTQLNRKLKRIGNRHDADAVAIIGSILPGLETALRDAIEAIPDRKDSVAVVLHTPGGVVEVVERMVTALRHAYGKISSEVIMIVPDRAMSAGTIFALSADRIIMDHLSCLGPIDPQIEKDGNLVPALSYLNQFERLNEKAQSGQLTTAEYALLNKLDLGELYQFEQARELSIELIVKWLSSYKFKNWNKTECNSNVVDKGMKEKRAQEIAELLNDPGRWHSHGRAIDRKTLGDEVKLKIENLEDDPDLRELTLGYFHLLRDYMNRENIPSIVHSRGYF